MNIVYQGPYGRVIDNGDGTFIGIDDLNTRIEFDSDDSSKNIKRALSFIEEDINVINKVISNYQQNQELREDL